MRGLVAVMLAGCSFSLQPAPPADAPPDTSIDARLVWIIEAEDTTSRTMPAVHQWVPSTMFAGYSGASHMHLAGGNGSACVNDVSMCASMIYAVTLIEGGTYHFHVRMLATSGGNDSVWVSIDDPNASAIEDVAVPYDLAWHWGTSGSSYTLPAGAHRLHIWHREGGANVDRLALIESTTPPP